MSCLYSGVGVELRFHAILGRMGYCLFLFHFSASDPFSLSLYPLILGRKPTKRFSVNAASSMLIQQIDYSFLKR